MSARIAAALQAAITWELQNLEDENSCRMPGTELPEVPWLHEAESALREYNAQLPESDSAVLGG